MSITASAAGSNDGKVESAPRLDIHAPHRRHLLNHITPRMRKKTTNSILLPHIDVLADVAAIRLGRAVQSSCGDWIVNGRLYGVEAGGTYFPARAAALSCSAAAPTGRCRR